MADVTDPDLVAAISAAVADHPISIADGHHRYTTALAYRERRAEDAVEGPEAAIMALVAPAEGSGLRVAPYHRIFGRVGFDPAQLTEAFEINRVEPAEPDEPGTLVVVSAGQSLFLRARRDRLDALPRPWQQASTAVAREILYPVIGVEEGVAEYTPDWERAVAEARAREGLAVLMAPVSEEAISAASTAGLRFPQKSTFFTPKPRAGLVMRVFDTP